MPFDTRIAVLIQAEGHRDEHGEYVDGPTTEYPRWADESGAGSGTTPTEGGLITGTGRTFVVRWFNALAIAPEAFVSIRDNINQVWYSEAISASDARKRFIVIAAGRLGL